MSDNLQLSCNFDMGISYTPIFLSESTVYKITDSLTWMSIQYFLHTIITLLLAALSAGTKT